MPFLKHPKSVECKKCSGIFATVIPRRAYCDPCYSKCTIDGCEGRQQAKGLCGKHMDRFRKYGSLSPQGLQERMLRPADGQCTIEGCDRDYYVRGLCTLHYNRKQRTGDVGPVKPVIKPDGTGSITVQGYRRIKTETGAWLLVHRKVMSEIIGRPLKRGEYVHHKDGDRENNDPSNLELWSKSQPPGQRVSDKVSAAIALLREHSELPEARDYLFKMGGDMSGVLGLGA